MAAFNGFSTENLVPLPAEFFTDVLPVIASPAELKVTLHVFWVVSRQRGRAKRISWDSLLADETLTRSLRMLSPLRPVAELLEEGLGRSLERGTLLHLVSAEAGRAVSWYLVNTAANRTWVERHGGTRLEQPDESPPAQPSLFSLYEQNILERWEADGKEPAPHRPEQSFDLRKYTTGKYAAFFGRSEPKE